MLISGLRPAVTPSGGSDPDDCPASAQQDGQVGGVYGAVKIETLRTYDLYIPDPFEAVPLDLSEVALAAAQDVVIGLEDHEP